MQSTRHRFGLYCYIKDYQITTIPSLLPLLIAITVNVCRRGIHFSFVVHHIAILQYVFRLVHEIRGGRSHTRSDLCGFTACVRENAIDIEGRRVSKECRLDGRDFHRFLRHLLVENVEVRQLLVLLVLLFNRRCYQGTVPLRQLGDRHDLLSER